MSKTNILMADANFCCLPVLYNIQSITGGVAVCGNLASDPCHALAAQSYPVDYSDRDALAKLVEQEGFKYLVSGCNDCSYLSSSWVANSLNLPGYDDYETSTILLHKDKFRAFAEAQDYPIPSAATDLDTAIADLCWPMIVKPIDSFSGRGVTKVSTKDELIKAWDDAILHSSSKAAVVEEFFEGALHSHSAFVKKGKIIAEFFVDEFCTVYPYQVNSSCLSFALHEQTRQRVSQWCNILASDLNLCDGLIHTQFICNNGDFRIIEVTRRCPGDLYSQLITESTGVDYSALYAAPFIGASLPDNVEVQKRKFITRHTVSNDFDSVFVSAGVNISSRRSEFLPILKLGDVMEKAPFGKSGIIFTEFNSFTEMQSYTPNFKNFVFQHLLPLSGVSA